MLKLVWCFISCQHQYIQFKRDFVDLFLEFLFKPGTKINPDHKAKYIFLLAYASCVVEVWRKVGTRLCSTCCEYRWVCAGHTYMYSVYTEATEQTCGCLNLLVHSCELPLTIPCARTEHAFLGRWLTSAVPNFSVQNDICSSQQFL